MVDHSNEYQENDALVLTNLQKILLVTIPGVSSIKVMSLNEGWSNRPWKFSFYNQVAVAFTFKQETETACLCLNLILNILSFHP